MAITFEALQELIQREGFQFYVHPSFPQLVFGVTGMLGTHQLAVTLFEEGTFLQFRSVNNLHCPPDHPHLAEVHTALGALNSQYRLLKFAREPQYGEITVFADHWIVDSTLTTEQLKRILAQYLSTIDVAVHRIRAAIETGRDPGEQSPAELAREVLARYTGLPPALRAAVEQLARGEEPTPSPEADIEEL